ncbi:MAG: biotin--[acetyl-CoA-carboxylase] ligase, partial [Clostridia bacterium]|nr:biotin--[acetyl-CoA-carboxylase] ligase [Clostridia bacterium]
MSTKHDVLAALLATDAEISGETLAEQLHVSRNAVWKAINLLRSEGHTIEAVTNRGYRLMRVDEVVTEEGIREHLKGSVFGASIEVHDCIDSTNTRAKALAAQGAPHGTMVCARQQTGGRGRFGRPFFSPKGSGIYVTFILRPTASADVAVMLTAMTAVATARAIEALADVKVGIKWVNDLYIDGKKACGILCEGGLDFESGQLEYVVAGIGVNTAPVTFPEELADIATAVGNACGKDISKNALLAGIANEMEKLYESFEQGTFMAEYRERSTVIGKDIIVMRGNERFGARVKAIDDRGGLIIETEN